MPQSKKILAVTYGGGHSNVIFPVVDELRSRGYSPLLLALTSAGPRAEKFGLPYKGFRHYSHLIDEAEARKLGEPLTETMHSDNMEIPMEESIFYLGINVLNSNQDIGVNTTNEIIKKAGRQALLPVGFLKKILEFEKIDLVVTTNAPRSEKAALIAGYQKNIPTVRIEDLYGQTILYDSFDRKLGKKLHKETVGRFKFCPTISCFLCEFARRNFIKNQKKWDVIGANISNTKVTGQPIFDAIDRIVKSPAKFDIFPKTANLPTITWTHEEGHPDHFDTETQIQEWFKTYGCYYNVIVKVRPNLSTDELKTKFLPKQINRSQFKIIHKDVDPNKVLWNSHVIIGQESTMLTQAAYMGKPVIVIDPQRIRAESPLVKTKVASLAHSAPEIDSMVKQLLDTNSTQYKQFKTGLKEISFQTNGTMNVVDAIESVMV